MEQGNKRRGMEGKNRKGRRKDGDRLQKNGVLVQPNGAPAILNKMTVIKKPNPNCSFCLNDD